jgi:type IX secretion system PorP/SprF family membrane protein
MNRIGLLLIAVCLSGLSEANAQDIHFSQFYQAPLHLNPALTGVMNCNQRISGNYRNQWASVLRDKAFNTGNVSYDQRVPVGRYDFMGFGGSLWNDQAGSLNLRLTQLHGNFSYSKKMAGGKYRNSASYLVMGVDVGVAQRGIDYSQARWGTQNNNGSFDPSLVSGESDIFRRDQYIYPEVGAGLMWFSVIDRNTNWFVGGAYHHINRANQSFTGDKFIGLYSKFTIHGGAEFKLADRIGLIPGAVIFLQGPSFQTNLGTSLKFLLGSMKTTEEAIQFGLWSRMSNKTSADNKSSGGILMDALIASTRFDYNQFSIGFSYDLNVSSLRPASHSNGAFEFSLLYKICGNTNRNVYCPNF